MSMVFYFKMKFNQKNNLYLINVDVSASTEAFLEMVCLIAIRRSVSRRTGCRRWVQPMSIFKDSLWYSVRLSAYFPWTVTAAIYHLY